MRKSMRMIATVLLGVMPVFGGLLSVIAKDDQGAPIENVEVLAINVQTKFQVKKATNKFGTAHLGWIPGGVYKVTATHSGRTVPVKDVNVTAAPVQIEFKSLTGGVSAASEVAAAAK